MSAHRIARGPRSAAGEDAGRKGVGFERRSRLLIGQLAPFWQSASSRRWCATQVRVTGV